MAAAQFSLPKQWEDWCSCRRWANLSLVVAENAVKQGGKGATFGVFRWDTQFQSNFC